MALEHDDTAHDPKDYTPYLWGGILLLFVVMIGLIMALGKSTPVSSQVQAKHILVKFDQSDPADRARALQRIQELRERLVNGESFEKLARENSDDEGSAGRGGDLGPMARGQYQQQFEDFVWTAPLNQLSEIVQTSHGYHLIVVTARHLSAGDEYEIELEKRVSEERGSKAETAPAP